MRGERDVSRSRLAPLLQGAAVAALWLAATAASAATHRVDDSGSQVMNPNVQMRWDANVPGARGRGVAGALEVALRLDVAAWRGRNGRIYMTLPASPSGPLQVAWTTQGRLLPGRLVSGERALVYAGPIGEDALRDRLRLDLQADGQRLDRAQTLTFSFEIDLDEP
ncbi:hypothetical protein D9T17_03425 [Lysobacter enzymogenes]|uniref:Uncharacterized protein n=2 Tax=Lysobacter TaxID=68 RepID=A0A3N2RMC7_LYSEN|nr:hypothetical protein D9T17_03425 [Lysobacter enzymogenes]